MNFREFIRPVSGFSVPEGNPLIEMFAEDGKEVTLDNLLEHIKELEEELDIKFTTNLLEKRDDVVYEVTIKKIKYQLVDVGDKYQLVVNGIKTTTEYDDLEQAKADLDSGEKFYKHGKQKHLGSKIRKEKQ